MRPLKQLIDAKRPLVSVRPDDTVFAAQALLALGRAEQIAAPQLCGVEAEPAVTWLVPPMAFFFTPVHTAISRAQPARTPNLGCIWSVI